MQIENKSDDVKHPQYITTDSASRLYRAALTFFEKPENKANFEQWKKNRTKATT